MREDKAGRAVSRPVNALSVSSAHKAYYDDGIIMVYCRSKKCILMVLDVMQM